VVDLTDTPATARGVMSEHRVDWVGVREGERLLGWVGEADLNGDPTVAAAPRKPFRAVYRGDTSLKAALDGIVTSQIRVAVVVEDDDRYRGMLTVDDLAEGITT
jgi:CBS domain-containing protein